MIDKKSLRIGNLVVLAHENNASVITIKEIGQFEASIDEDDATYPYDLLTPIELTPEWMGRCGFETPDGYNTSVLFNEIMIDFHLGEYKLRDKPKARLKYLHQLQNVFYWLTGEELIIKSFNQSN